MVFLCPASFDSFINLGKLYGSNVFVFSQTFLLFHILAYSSSLINQHGLTWPFHYGKLQKTLISLTLLLSVFFWNCSLFLLSTSSALSDAKCLFCLHSPHKHIKNVTQWGIRGIQRVLQSTHVILPFLQQTLEGLLFCFCLPAPVISNIC